jgi:hypothetical protein
LVKILTDNSFIYIPDLCHRSYGPMVWINEIPSRNPL